MNWKEMDAVGDRKGASGIRREEGDESRVETT
jgi:hypothetical protein